MEKNTKGGKLVYRRVMDCHGYGKKDPRPGCHLLKQSRENVAATITTKCHMNLVVLEIYDDGED